MRSITDTTTKEKSTMTDPTLTQPSTTAVDLASLESHFTGRLATPADADWDALRAPWNLSIDQHPELVALPENVDSVTAVILFAHANGLRVMPQGTGHGAGAAGDLAGTILLRTHRMRQVTVDATRLTARAEAGAVWSEVTAALAPHGLAGRAGSSGSVGVTGYSLGGGYSWLARRHGLAASSITAVELVTGDGFFHRVDAEHEPELFWAVRGGGGNVGVVCALEFTVLAVPRVYGGMLMFPLERAADVLSAYEEWTRELDEAATTCVRLLRLPAMPELPELLRGKALAVIDGAIDAPTEEAERMLAPLRALSPMVDTFADIPVSALGDIHMDPPAPTPGRGDGLILDDLPGAAIDALLALAGPGIESPLLAVDLRHLGGAIGRPAATGGAVDHLPGRFLVNAVGIAPTPGAVAEVEHHIRSLQDALAEWTIDRDYMNFREVAVGSDRFYSSSVLSRLLAVRAEFDPDGVIRTAHPLRAV